MEKKKRQNLDSQGSEHSGLVRLFELALRKLKTLVHLVVLAPIAGLYCACMGLALVPGISLFQWSLHTFAQQPIAIQYFAWGTSIAAGYLAYGLSLICIIPAVCFLSRAYAKPFRGPYYSAETVRWYLSNGLLYLVRYSFLEFITPTPFNLFFYRKMGMTIGKGTQINSTHISDPAMIRLGDKVTIGGSAVIVAHYGQGGFLVIAPVVIESGATIGLRATIMGDVVIGENAKILPNSVVMPKTRVPANEVWGGVPARKIDPETLRISQAA